MSHGTNIDESIKEVLKSYDITFAQKGLARNIEAWRCNKGNLVALLRKHPNWDEETLGLVFEMKQVREISKSKVSLYRHRLNDLTDEMLMTVEDRHDFHSALFYVADNGSQYLNEDTARRVKESSQIDCSSGQKSSRVINNLCKKYGVDKHSRYNAYFALLADALNPLESSRKAILSLHPCDFLEMSNKRNSWSSCHNLEHGSFAAGTLSYMNDGVTMIFYTIDDDEVQPYFKAPKITRQVFCYENGILLQSRLYPDDKDNKARENYLNIVQEALAICENKANSWTLKQKFYDVSIHVKTHGYALHYCDYKFQDYKSNVSLLKHRYSDSENVITVGNPSFCVNCGEYLSEKGDLICNDWECCNEYECADCGISMSEDNNYRIGGENYCRDCVDYCPICNEYYRGGSHLFINDFGNSIWICEYCHNQCVEAENENKCTPECTA